MTTQSDDHLLREAGRGAQGAFTALYERYQPGLFRFALHMTGSRTIAEEVTHDVFLQVIRGGTRYDPSRGTVAAYLYGVARNYVLRALRDRGQSVTLTDEDEATCTSQETSPLDDLTSRSRIEALRKAVLTLPDAYRETLVLCDLEEMSQADAAVALGVPLGSIKSRLSRARELLARKLRGTVVGCSA